MTINHRTLVPALVVALGLVLSSSIIASAQTATSTDASSTASLASVTYPIAELGGCADRAACKAYCDVQANAAACLAFAKTHRLLPPETIDRGQKYIALLKKGGPGGCTTKDSCETYCENAANAAECRTFASNHGLITSDDLNRQEKLSAALASSAGPGGCIDAASCKTYCESPDHRSECLSFARSAGLISEGDAARMASGEATSTGPGGCTSRESCDAFCNDSANMQECIDFARVHSFLDADKLAAVQSGVSRLRMGLENLPEKAKACIMQKLGTGIAAKVQDGSFLPTSDQAAAIKECVGQNAGEVRTEIKTKLEEAIPSVKDCLRQMIGTSTIAQLEEGETTTTGLSDVLRKCFGGMVPPSGGMPGSTPPSGPMGTTPVRPSEGDNQSGGQPDYFPNGGPTTTPPVPSTPSAELKLQVPPPPANRPMPTNRPGMPSTGGRPQPF